MPTAIPIHPSPAQAQAALELHRLALALNPAIVSRLGLGLRGLYQYLTEEPVPDFLAVFIRELEDREQRASR